MAGRLALKTYWLVVYKVQSFTVTAETIVSTQAVKLSKG
jgi:hypothetical protein